MDDSERRTYLAESLFLNTDGRAPGDPLNNGIDDITIPPQTDYWRERGSHWAKATRAGRVPNAFSSN